ncbi:hypothetical protein GGH94_004701 [Coemansia aciculifera]|uniref:Uncharacterized protein n=1 Tax=Coemansia aciculifera TaxID=417176 RepID=A0A9W8IEY1_9FUNG|nr:hypothetical protein GGH94_004701 [Coemansia aciculifera]
MENRGDELHEFLQNLELLQYYEAFRREGFERLESCFVKYNNVLPLLNMQKSHHLAQLCST